MTDTRRTSSSLDRRAGRSTKIWCTYTRHHHRFSFFFENVSWCHRELFHHKHHLFHTHQHHCSFNQSKNHNDGQPKKKKAAPHLTKHRKSSCSIGLLVRCQEHEDDDVTYSHQKHSSQKRQLWQLRNQRQPRNLLQLWKLWQLWRCDCLYFLRLLLLLYSVPSHRINVVLPSFLSSL